MQPPITIHAGRWVKQFVYALILVGVIMGLHWQQWFGLEAAERYVVFILTEQMDVQGMLPRLDGWLDGWRWDALWPWGGGEGEIEGPVHPEPMEPEGAGASSLRFLDGSFLDGCAMVAAV